MSKVIHPKVAERIARGRAAREVTPPDAHAGWEPAFDRRDPIALLEEQNTTREADLVPVRHGRMMVSPFTFYRGAAKIMADDLAATPTAGLDSQLCGDAHLSNFGLFASPERTLLFGLNDFDETLPGPFEYDVKRMAASFTIAARNNGFTEAGRVRGDDRIGDCVSRDDDRIRGDADRWPSGTRALRRKTSRTWPRRWPARRRARSTRSSPRARPPPDKRRAPATASRPCRSWRSSSTASTGS